jgi:hypothetical protein
VAEMPSITFEVEIVCEREDLVTLKIERLIRITTSDIPSYEGFAILRDGDEIQLRNFQ